MSMEIAVIGGGGHVGLPMGLILADAGHTVTLVDTDAARLATIESGTMPFNEPGGERLLEEALEDGRLTTSTELAAVADCRAIICVVGTPIDAHHNPQMDNLVGVVDGMLDHLDPGDLLVFRSTVYPGTTNIVRKRLERAGFRVGEDLYLAFAPERIAQHRAIEEIVGLPQLIGAFDDESYEHTVALFGSFLEAECHRLSPTEAELGKLFTNMWRYLTFAAANEFYLVAESFATQHEVNINRIIAETGRGYPRFDVPTPGANVGGPCLTKDGWFLVDNIPYNELVSAAYQINEGMPAQLVDRLERMAPDPEKIAVLGMTFKANSDDTRNSVAFKLRKQLRMKGYFDVVEIEPNCEGFDEWAAIADSDWVILMTPHDEFADLERIAALVDNDDCVYCDVWGFWDDFEFDSDNGYFTGHDVAERLVTDGEVAR